MLTHEPPADTQPEKGITDRYTRSDSSRMIKSRASCRRSIAAPCFRLSRRTQNSNLTVVAILGDSRSAVTSANLRFINNPNEPHGVGIFCPQLLVALPRSPQTFYHCHLKKYETICHAQM